MTAKRLIAWGLEALCGLLDKIPAVYRDDDRWRVYRCGALGCRFTNLAIWSCKLDARWDTGVWRQVP